MKIFFWRTKPEVEDYPVVYVEQQEYLQVRDDQIHRRAYANAETGANVGIRLGARIGANIGAFIGAGGEAVKSIADAIAAVNRDIN